MVVVNAVKDVAVLNTSCVVIATHTQNAGPARRPVKLGWFGACALRSKKTLDHEHTPEERATTNSQTEYQTKQHQTAT